MNSDQNNIMKKGTNLLKFLIFPLLILLSVCFLGIGYGAMNGVALEVSGTASTTPQEGVFISNVQLKGATASATGIINQYYQNILNSKITLSKSDKTSSITYTMTVYNNTTETSTFIGINYGDNFYTNEDIVYELNGLKLGDEIGAKKSITFTITFKYKDNIGTITNNILESYLNFKFGKTSSILKQAEVKSTTNIFGKEMDKTSIEKIEFVNNINVPSTASAYWDASQDKDNSVLAWTIPSTTGGMYTLYIGGIKGTVIANTDSSYAFYGFSSAKEINFNNYYDTSKATKAYYMFYDCSSVTSLDVSSFNTSNITNMGRMFSACSKLTTLDLSNFITSKVTDMHGMFQECTGITTLDLSNFDTSSATSLGGMFLSCSSLTSLNISRFNTLKVTDMNQIFWHCISLTSIDVSGWDTSGATSMEWMFADCENLTNLDLSNFNTSNVTTMRGMFTENDSLVNLNVSNFNTSKVTTTYAMFKDSPKLTNLDLSNFDTSSVTDSHRMFQGCNKLTTIDLRKADFSKITDYSNMFTNVPNNAKIYVKDTTQKSWITGKFTNLTNVAIP